MRSWISLGAVGFLLALLAASSAQGSSQVDYVIQISVDGLRPDAITALGPNEVPNFYRMRSEGVFTDNARTDYWYTTTLPSHVCHLTGRPVLGGSGHAWTGNSTPPPGATLHLNKGSYVAGAYDVAHDNGLATGFYPGKSKLSLFDVSWDANNGALDITGPDNGRDKIDTYYYSSNPSSLTSTFVTDMGTFEYNYSFLHLINPDSAGHSTGWNPSVGSPYSNSVKAVDGLLGSIFNLIDTDATFTDKTAVILTADHGGSGTGHGSASTREIYTIPFYAWGPGFAAGADLYRLNPATRQDPSTGRPPQSDPIQPIRHADIANLALDLLGLGAIPGSVFNSAQDLVVAYTLGDMDFSAVVNTDDISPFVLAITDPNAYVAQYGLDPNGPGDCNGSGGLNTDDINSFVALLTGGSQAVPEPAMAAMLLLGAAALLRKRRWRRAV